MTSRNEEPAVLARTIGGVLDSCSAAERDVIVVDDGSRSPVLGLPSEVRLVRNAEPLGVSRARRLGCSLARREVLVVLDAHMTFGEGWLAAMLQHIERGVLLCGAYWDYERSRHASFGADLYLETVRDYAGGRTPGVQVAARMSESPAEVHEVPAVLGGCYAISLESYTEMGGFCPLFGTWGVDEQDVSIRTWMSGGRVLCVPKASVGHLTRSGFPYAVGYDDVEVNQLLMIRSIFGFRTVQTFEKMFRPLSDSVRQRVDATDLRAWRRAVQSTRERTDIEILDHLLPRARELLDNLGS